MCNFKEKTCVVCGDIFKPKTRRDKRCVTCMNVRCYACGEKINTNIGRILSNPKRTCLSCYVKDNHSPNGTTRINANGYCEIKTNDGWVLEHRHVMEIKIGRKLKKGETVHHDDEDRANNDPENLILTKGIRGHLENHHKDSLKNPPVHHFGNKKWGKEEYEIFNKARR